MVTEGCRLRQSRRAHLNAAEVFSFDPHGIGESEFLQDLAQFRDQGLGSGDIDSK
jgi:hypothetical protein